MVEKTPVRVNYDGSGNPTGFAELQSTEFIGLDDGGTGGSGVVIVRYPTLGGTISVGAGLTSSTTTDGLYKVTSFTAGTGTISWS